MIKVTVEIIPNGEESKKEKISEVFITNTSVRSPLGSNGFLYDYDGWLSENEYSELELSDRVHHERHKNVWWLVRNVAMGICAETLE